MKVKTHPKYSNPREGGLRGSKLTGAQRAIQEGTPKVYAVCLLAYSQPNMISCCCYKTLYTVGNFLNKTVRERTDMNVPWEYSHPHTTSRVAEAGISFPTDLEKYMSAPAFFLAD